MLDPPPIVYMKYFGPITMFSFMILNPNDLVQMKWDQLHCNKVEPS